MDLRSVLNTADNGERAAAAAAAAAARAPPTPQQQQQQQQQPRPPPSPAQYPYRGDYPHHPSQPPPQQSPVAQEYAHHHPGHPQQHDPRYPPASPYQNAGPPPPGSYPGRPAPPPLVTGHSNPSFHDVRSPGSMAAPSPYRQPPTPSGGPGAGSAYPFPAQPDMTSPVQRHQYPPAQYQPHQRRDSYSQGVAAPASAAPGPYVQQHPPVPQTPPVATPGSHPYPHQRSQSVQSTPTPTSAHSQHAFPPHHPPHGSPVATAHPPPEYGRQPSQPPAPLGPPTAAGPSGPRQSNVPGNFAQPPSPYQQRTPSLAHSQIPQPHSSPHPAAPPRPPQRMSSGSHSTYESPARESFQRPPSSHDREHSMSVSPKTRVSSLPSNPDYHRQSLNAEIDPRHSSHLNQGMSIDVDRTTTPAKRKLEDRDLSPRELERREPRPPPGEVNGAHVPMASKTSSPVVQRARRVPRREPPIWAQSIHSLGKQMPSHANFVLQKKPEPNANGNKDRGSRSPDRQEPGPQDQLGPWEVSITGIKPSEGNAKELADFLFMHVVSNPDIQEILSHRIQFEIEAKLGTLIDKDTNQRVERRGRSEFILDDDGRTAFKSSMTEVHHKSFNDFLNQTVIMTDPRHPNNQGGPNRVQVVHKHRREIDRFFELPPDLQARIPGCVRSRLARGRNIKARVTYDQKSNAVLSKIIKARVADLDIHIPSCPMDCRISINLEMNWDGPVEELEALGSNQERAPDRTKDRVSYKHGHYQIDLTQVSQTIIRLGNSRVEKEHELEIELSPNILMDQGRKAMNGAHNRYQELVEGFLDNVRVLARKARDFHH